MLIANLTESKTEGINDDHDSGQSGYWAVLAIPVLMTIHLLYILLLVAFMSRDGSLWRRPINTLILTDETFRFLGSLGSLAGLVNDTIFIG